MLNGSAAKFFARFEEVGGSEEEDYRFEAIDESEARQVKELCREVSENLQNIEVDGKYLTGKKAVTELLGLVVTYHRYGRKVMNL